MQFYKIQCHFIEVISKCRYKLWGSLKLKPVVGGNSFNI